MGSRHFCFTSYKLEILPKDIYDGDIRYLVWQLERCPDTGNLHYQCYVELHKVMRWNRLKRIIGDDGMHIESREGTRDEAREYCMKEDTRVDGPWEYGKWISGSGHRSDLDEVAEKLKTKSIKDVALEFPGTYVKYHKGLEKFKELLYEPRDKNKAPEVIVITGPTGIGKTRWAYDRYETADIYHKMGGKWWDGYTQQKVVLFDDFDKDIIPYRTMLQILDRYPLRVENKGGSIELNSEIFIITSNVSPYCWYPEEDISPLLRRVTRNEVLG